MNICDECAAKEVITGRARPYIQVYGPNNTCYCNGTCEMCGKNERIAYHPDIQKPPPSP